MRPRVVVSVVVVVLAVYLVLVGYQGLLLVRTGDPVPVVLGLAILVLPMIGAYVVWREIQFGAATSRLARRLQEAGRWPTEQLPLRPSGRPERAAADALFAKRQHEVEAQPDDWGAWYRLGLAYDDAGDRRRARAAIRHAIHLSSQSGAAT